MAGRYRLLLLTALLAGSYPAIYPPLLPPHQRPEKYRCKRPSAYHLSPNPGRAPVHRQRHPGHRHHRRLPPDRLRQDRPVGYDRKGLLSLLLKNPADIRKLPTLRQELIRTGVVVETTRFSAAATDYGDFLAGYSWPRKNPSTLGEFATSAVSRGYGQTIGWTVVRAEVFQKILPPTSPS